MLITLAVGTAFAWPFHGTTGGAGPVTTCPNGTTWPQDGCSGADLTSLFVDANAVSKYVLDASGNPGTLNHFATDYNRAGIDFPVGPKSPYIYTDPANMSFSCSSCSTNGTTTLTITTISGGGTCRPNEILWQTGFITDHPKILSCSSPTAPATATLDRTESSHSGAMSASIVPGCVWTQTGGFGSSSNAAWSCSFTAPNTGTALFDHVEFGPVGGHAASLLHVVGSTAGSGLKITNSHFLVDSFLDSAGQSFVTTVVGTNAFIDFEFNECDGGNEGVAPGSANSSFIFPHETTCLGWQGRGVLGTPLPYTFSYNYIHDWGGNPISLDLAYTSETIQANVFLNNGGANGDSPVGNGFHGSQIQFGTTAIGAENYAMHHYNNSIWYPAGFRAGVTTAAQAFLCGLGSSLTYDDLDVKLDNIYASKSSSVGHSVMAGIINPFRCGYIASFKANHNYWNMVGSGSCINAGGDVQSNSPETSTMVANAGSGTSVWTTSGWVGPSTSTLPHQYQTLFNGAGSGTPNFTATLTASGANSILNITHTYVGTTSALAAGTQIIGLRLATPWTNPLVIVSGSGTTYTVSDGTGAGRTLANQDFITGHTIQAYGAGGTTATGGTSLSGYQGTYLVGGEENVGSQTGNWSVTGIGLGNYATIDSDITDNWDIQTAGASGAIIVDGINLSSAVGVGQCPNTTPN